MILKSSLLFSYELFNVIFDLHIASGASSGFAKYLKENETGRKDDQVCYHSDDDLCLRETKWTDC